MARFTLNRQMTFILALIATLAMSPAVSRPVHADGSRTGSGDPTGPTDPGYSGDPDYPVGSPKNNRSGIRNQEWRSSHLAPWVTGGPWAWTAS